MRCTSTRRVWRWRPGGSRCPRRTGGKDAGWHLKLPVSADERREITEPLTDDPETVPVRLRSWCWSIPATGSSFRSRS
jgi:hypothetical protein